MKKFLFCLFCLLLVGCGNDSMTGVCYVEEKTISVNANTEETITKFICNCFDTKKSDAPQFRLQISHEQARKQNCYKECTALCNKEQARQSKD
jgi:hypothetical protein